LSYSTVLTQAGLNGLVIGAMYMLMAVGFTLVFGIMRVVNFAHGEFYMLGAFVAFFTYVYWDLPFVVCLAIAALTIGILGMLIERTLIQPFLKAAICTIPSNGCSVFSQSFGSAPARWRARCPAANSRCWRLPAP
jgi:branched-subunit amino acid ABC-type transport system permease component